jgi:hypothetical protein
MAESAGYTTRAVSITLAAVGAISRRGYVSDASSDADETRLLIPFTTAQSLNGVRFPLFPMSPLEYKEKS